MKKNDLRFKNFIENVPKEHIFAVRKCILKQCRITTSCYYRWISGDATPSLERRLAINKIAKRYNYPTVYEYAKSYKAQAKLTAHQR